MKCQHADRRGAAAVEFALTAPILFALVLGAIEFSRANMLVHTTSIAATEAARRSIIPGATANEVRLKALDELGAVGVSDASVVLDPPEIVDDTTQVTVTLTVPVSLRNGYGLSRIFLGRHVYKSVTLQREGKSVEVASETTPYDGIRAGAGNPASEVGSGGGSSGNSGNGNGNANGNNGNAGNGGGNGNGNNGNGNGNGGGDGSNGNSGSGNSGNGNGGSGSGNSGASGAARGPAPADSGEGCARC
jgi:Flp pilus assembly protein TadG